jgi:fatty acid synthase subunit alpha, fungi type
VPATSGGAKQPGTGKLSLEGTAEVAQPTTVYAFTGQGSQEQGMGMDLYNSSPAARVVWDSADAHLIYAYGCGDCP